VLLRPIVRNRTAASQLCVAAQISSALRARPDIQARLAKSGLFLRRFGGISQFQPADRGAQMKGIGRLKFGASHGVGAIQEPDAGALFAFIDLS